MKILVTGGAGYIGSHTVVELVEAGYEPVVVDNFANSDKSVLKNLEKLIGKPVSFYQLDYRDVTKLRSVMEKEAIGGIIHFAAYKAVGESVAYPLKYYENNVNGFIDLLRLVKGLDWPVNLVLSSSCTVYGNPDRLPVTEDSPVKPAESPYGATKQIDEMILKDVAASANLKALALRYFNPIGAHPSALIGELPIGTPANLVPFVTQTAAGWREQLTVYGDDYPTNDGSCVRDYIHVVDLAKAHVKALRYLETKSAKTYDTVNIGTGRGVSVLELIKTFENATGEKLPYAIGPRRKGDVIATYASAAKAKKLLGWEAEKSLSGALRDAWRWQQTLDRP